MNKKLTYMLNDGLQLNEVESYGDGHDYIVTERNGKTIWHQHINFTKGGRNTKEHEAGLTHEALILICIDRLKYFDETFNTTENQQAIEHLEQALLECETRTQKRHEQGTLGNDGEDYDA